MRIMGIKFLNLRMIPWCFQLMGNPAAESCPYEQPHPPPPLPPPVKNTTTNIIKLIKSDGFVKIYDRPISVSELLVEYPKHLVCDSDSFYIGQKIPALSDKDKLQLGQKYFLLPKHLFQSVLSFVTIASFASTAAAGQKPQQAVASPMLSARRYSKNNTNSTNAILMKKAATTANCKPFEIQKTASGYLKINVSDEFISQLIEEGKNIISGSCHKEEEEEEIDVDDRAAITIAKSRVCTTAQLEKDYMQLVRCRRHWKPKLESIREIEKKKRKVLSSSFRMKRSTPSRNNKTKSSTTTQNIIRSEHHHLVHLTSCAKPVPRNSKSKIIKFRSRKS